MNFRYDKGFHDLLLNVNDRMTACLCFHYTPSLFVFLDGVLMAFFKTSIFGLGA